jgi:hypothetical protein
MKNKNIIILVVLTISTVIILNLPFGNFILYPFTILGTWFHEMGHGLTAMMLGAEFYKLEIYSNGSGVATHSVGNYLGAIGNGIIALGGPLGPTFAGTVLLIASKKEKSSKIILLILGVFMILSVLIWIRSLIGALIIGLLGALIIYITYKKNYNIYSIVAQFLGLQAFASTYQSFDYFFSSGGSIGTNYYQSDTGFMQQYLLLPYWFWASFIILVSIVLLLFSLKSLIVTNKKI